MDEFDNAESLAAQFHDRLSGMGHDGGNAGGGGRGGKRGGGKRGGGGGGGSASSRAVNVSRALSRLLRHQAANAGIPLDPEGYAPLDRVLQWGPLRSMKVSVAEVRDIVATNDKQRFALRPKNDSDGDAGGDSDDAADYLIRANQGHSIASVASDAGLLTPIDDPDAAPPVVCHGTFFAFWPAIEASGGLKRMSRNHVHLGCLETEPADLKSEPVVPGLRRDAQLLVYVDVRRALSEDPSLKWWRAANGVILTEGDADGLVPTRFFKRVVTSREGALLLPPRPAAATTSTTDVPKKHELVLWEEGQKVADLPAETLAKARVPPGKQAVAQRTQDKQGKNQRPRVQAKKGGQNRTADGARGDD